MSFALVAGGLLLLTMIVEPIVVNLCNKKIAAYNAKGNLLSDEILEL